MKSCLTKACRFVKDIKGHEKMSVDAIASKLKARCGLSREARRKAIKAFRANEKKLQKAFKATEKKLHKSLKIGMKQANEGKVFERDFSEFAPNFKKLITEHAKKTANMSIDQEVAYLRKRGWIGSRDQIRAWVKYNRARR